MRGPVLIAYLIFAAILATAAVIFISAEAHRTSYTEGYCAALGGQPIAAWTCDVDGRVVKVP